MRGKINGISKDVRWAANWTYKYYDGINFEGLTSRHLIKIKAEDFDLIVKGWQLSREEVLLENIPVKAKILYDQVD